MSFDFYDNSTAQSNTRSSATPTVNLSKNGRLNFNKKATDEIIKDNLYALIGFDKATKTIAFKFLPTEDIKAVKLSDLNEKTKTKSVSAGKAFVKFGLNIDEFVGSYDLTVDKEYVIFTLKSNKLKINIQP